MKMNTGDRAVMNKAIMVLLIVVAAFVLILLFAGKKGTKISQITDFAETVTEQAILNVDGKHLVAQVAKTPKEREQGLSNTHFLNSSNGMLFVFDEVEEHGIWMKDMNVSIDIIWIDENNQIVDMEENVSPDTYPTIFTPDAPAKFVLEVIAGWAKENEVEIGDTVIVSEAQ